MVLVRSDDRELEEGDQEPSLSRLEASIEVYDADYVSTRNFGQTAKQGGSLDFEDQHDDREPDVDDEPSLCGIEACTVHAGGFCLQSTARPI